MVGSASRAYGTFWGADMRGKSMKEFSVIDADVENEEVGAGVFSGMGVVDVQGRDWKD